MIKHLFFFGKSQDFTFHAFDENERIEDYNQYIRDLEKLESSVFTVDKTDNLDILARYQFSQGGKTYSLLKMYSFGQAYAGDRVEGSTYGVAFLSDHTIEFSERNIKLLKTIKSKFAELSLNGSKFKYADFTSDATRIWQGFRQQSYFNLIDVSGPAQLVQQSSPAGVQLASIVDIPRDILMLSTRRNIIYLTEDRPHLERAKGRWSEHFDIYLLENGQYVMNPRPKQQVPAQKPTPERLGSGSGMSVSNSEQQIHDIQKEIAAERQKLKKLTNSVLTMQKSIWVIVFFLIVTLAGLLYLLFVDSIASTQKVPPKTAVIEKPQPNNINDKEGLRSLVLKIDTLILVNDKKKLSLKKEVAQSLRDMEIDTSRIRFLRIN